MHKFLFCSCTFQDFGQSQKNFAGPHDPETMTFRSSEVTMIFCYNHHKHKHVLKSCESVQVWGKLILCIHFHLPFLYSKIVFFKDLYSLCTTFTANIYIHVRLLSCIIQYPVHSQMCYYFCLPCIRPDNKFQASQWKLSLSTT